MHRLIVALLASVDAAIAAAVGLAATLAPLTLLWVFGFGHGADWGMLWQAAVSVWQFGNLVPLHITLPPEYLASAGIATDAASFVLSLAPLAFAAFTAIFAARSGARASHADAWLTGVVSSTVVFAALAIGAAFTGANEIARVETWQAILLPTLVFALPALVAAIVTEWTEAGSGAVARLRDRIEAAPHGWGDVPAVVARGAAVAVVGLIGAGAAAAAVALFARAGQIVALFQAGDVDVLGAVVITLGQLAYVPTLAVWGLSFLAGPGFAVGEGTAVSPAGTQVGVIPGLPVLGAVPESTTSWLLLLALVPVALGALAGWVARSRMIHPVPRGGGMPERDALAASSRFDSGRTAALTGLLSTTGGGSAEEDTGPDVVDDPMGARVVATVGIAVVAGAAAALLSYLASGSLGPGRLAEFGPQPGPVALAVALEVLLGAAILLLSPRGSRRGAASAPRDSVPEADEAPETLRDDVADDDGAARLAGGDEALAASASALARARMGGASERMPSAGAAQTTAAAGRTASSRPAPERPRIAEPEATTEPIDLP